MERNFNTTDSEKNVEFNYGPVEKRFVFNTSG